MSQGEPGTGRGREPGSKAKEFPWHIQEGQPAGPLSIQAPLGSGHVLVSRGDPRRIKGTSCKSPGSRGNYVWVESLAFPPLILNVLICVMGTTLSCFIICEGVPSDRC